MLKFAEIHVWFLKKRSQNMSHLVYFTSAFRTQAIPGVMFSLEVKPGISRCQWKQYSPLLKDRVLANWTGLW
jgi:hypothetical protein